MLLFFGFKLIYIRIIKKNVDLKKQIDKKPLWDEKYAVAHVS